MSLLTQAIIADRYGFRIGVEGLSEILHLTKGTIYNQLSAGTFPIKTYSDGNKRFADYRDVAEYLDVCRSKAGAGLPA